MRKIRMESPKPLKIRYQGLALLKHTNTFLMQTNGDANISSSSREDLPLSCVSSALQQCVSTVTRLSLHSLAPSVPSFSFLFFSFTLVRSLLFPTPPRCYAAPAVVHSFPLKAPFRNTPTTTHEENTHGSMKVYA
jgi:hypothetical protein